MPQFSIFHIDSILDFLEFRKLLLFYGTRGHFELIFYAQSSPVISSTQEIGPAGSVKIRLYFHWKAPYHKLTEKSEVELWAFRKQAKVDQTSPLRLFNEASLCGTVGKDFVYHASGHEFESRLK